MSHNFKALTSIDPRDRREERGIAAMSRRLDQTTLDKLLEGTTREMREALLARVAPYLSFVPEAAADFDCKQCGRKGGAAIAHECVDIATSSLMQ